MHKTISVFAVAFAVFVFTQPVYAQQTGKVPRVGFLLPGTPTLNGPLLKSLRAGLRELGYVEGRSIVLEPRFAMGKRDQLSVLADELVGLRPEVIVVIGAGAARAVRKAGPSVPIVVGVGGDLVRARVVVSLARPGGYTTGMTALSADLGAKQLQLLKETMPGLSRAAVLYSPVLSAAAAARQIKATGRVLGIRIQSVAVDGPGEFDGAFQAMAREKAEALIVVVSRLISSNRKRIIALASKWRLPAMCYRPAWGRSGCLMSYGANRLRLVRRAATYVDKILKGAKPADLPVEQPTRFFLTLNLKTAKALGITFPQSILLRADEVIE